MISFPAEMLRLSQQIMKLLAQVGLVLEQIKSIQFVVAADAENDAWAFRIMLCYYRKTRKSHKLWDYKAADVLGKFCNQQILMRIHRIFWCICNYYEFTTPITTKCCSICRRLAAIPMPSYDLPPPQFEPPFGGLGWT